MLFQKFVLSYVDSFSGNTLEQPEYSGKIPYEIYVIKMATNISLMC
jgi:hypothetical protein